MSQKMSIEEGFAEEGEESSDSDSDFGEVEASEEEMAKLTELEELLEANPNVYDKHTEYIALLRKCNMRARLNTARQAMQERFPLTEQLWLEWLDDQEANIRSTADAQELIRLSDVSVTDYLSIPLWIRYLRLLQQHDPEIKAGSTAGKERMRAAYEKALAAGGLHISAGSQLWQAARDYEASHADSINPKDPDSPLARLFARQLQVPLEDGPQTLLAWSRSCGSSASTSPEDILAALPGNVGTGYKRAQTAVQARAAYEAAASSSKPADMDLLAAYTAYIKLEEGAGEPGRVQCIYERALAKFPVTHILWLQYGQYLEQHLNLPGIVGQVYARATRNCPWISALWVRRLRALERGGGSASEQEELYGAALAAGMEAPEDYLEVALAYLDALRRLGPDRMEALRTAFQTATEMMQTYFPEYVDLALRIPAYWATTELKLGGSYQAGREVWEAALATPLSRHPEGVLGYVAFELAAEHVKEARSIFRKFHRRKMLNHGNVAVCEAWLRFEREHGSAEEFFQALVKAEPVLAQAANEATQAAEPELAAQVQAASKRGPQLSKAEAKQLRQEKDPNFGKAAPKEGQKRKTGLGFKDSQKGKRAKTEDPAAEEPRAQPAEFQSKGAQDVNMVDAPAASSQPEATPSAHQEPGKHKPHEMMPPPSRPPEAEAAAAPQAGEASQVQEVRPGQRTAYLKGIAPEVSKEELRALLDPCGTIVDFSLPEDRGAQPPRNRGFAYVVFGSSEALQRALALSGRELKGKSLSVAVAHKEVQPDQRTAFILNVAPGTSTEELEALLSSCGSITSTRIPIDRQTERPRGFAYVEFETSEGLQKAVDMTGIELNGQNLKINIGETSGSGGRGRGRGRARGPIRGAGARGRGGRGSAPRGGRHGGLENGGRGDFEAEPRAPRQQLDIQGTSQMFRPRSVGGGAPKTNADFRSLLKK